MFAQSPKGLESQAGSKFAQKYATALGFI